MTADQTAFVLHFPYLEKGGQRRNSEQEPVAYQECSAPHGIYHNVLMPCGGRMRNAVIPPGAPSNLP